MRAGTAGHRRSLGLAPRMGRLRSRAGSSLQLPQGSFASCSATPPPPSGCITHIGLDTFNRSAPGWRRLNDRTPPGLVERSNCAARTWLWYKAVLSDVALIRATAADPHGNLVMDEEGLFGEMLRSPRPA